MLSEDGGDAPLTVDRDLLGVHAGLRYTHRRGGFAVPYAQALAGWTRTGVDLAGRREVEDAFSVQPGVASTSGSREAWASASAPTTGWSSARRRAATSSGFAGLVLAIGDR